MKVSFRQNRNLEREGFAMKKRFAVEQIVAILKQTELGIPIADGTSTAEFGSPLLLYYPQPFGYSGPFPDFRQVLQFNPCPNQAPF